MSDPQPESNSDPESESSSDPQSEPPTETSREPEPFRYDAVVDPGEKRHVRYEVGETYLGDPIEMPVTIVNGEAGGPTLFLSAGIHGEARADD